MHKSIFIIIFVLSMFLAPQRVQASDYIQPSLANFMRTLVRFGALNLKEDVIVDAFGRVAECDIYYKHYRNDFMWQKIRGALRTSIKQDVATYPTAYYYDAELQLDRYDFKSGIYRFTEKTTQTSVNVFVIQAHDEEQCSSERQTFPPLLYRFVLDHPVQLAGLPLSDKEGQVLLARMNASGNKDRIIYTRFNLRVTYISPLSLKNVLLEGNKKTTPMVTQGDANDGVVMDSRLDSVEFYEDKEHKKLIYTLEP